MSLSETQAGLKSRIMSPATAPLAGKMQCIGAHHMRQITNFTQQLFANGVINFDQGDSFFTARASTKMEGGDVNAALTQQAV